MVAINSAKGSGKVTDALHVITKQSPPPAPILRFHKRQSPPLGVDVSWKSTARDIKEFRLRNAKEVEQIDDATLLKKLTYVENNFSRSVTSYNYTNFGMYTSKADGAFLSLRARTFSLLIEIFCH